MEEEFKYKYKYPHAAITTDSVVFGFDGKQLYILLIERGLEPYKGCWALPGGFMRMDETLEDGALRELREETGVRNIIMRQFHAFSNINRDPRERVVTIAFYALVRPSDYQVIGGDDAAKAQWYPIDKLPKLAFDHSEIVRLAKRQINEDARHTDIAFGLLNAQFSMGELQRLYEAITGVQYDRRNFERKMRATGLLQEEGIRKEKIKSRPAQLFSFDKQKYEQERMQKDGFFIL